MHVINSWSFALFSANLHRYLPKFSWRDHQILYDKWMDHHQKKPLSPQLHLMGVNEEVVRSCRHPSIISLFHLSDHLVWPVLLAQRGIHFNVILDRNVYQDAKEVFDGLLNRLSIYGHPPELLFSDDPALLLKIRSRKAMGQHLLCFADGASGSNTVMKDERIPVPFLEGKIWLKKGIPFISHLFGMPVISLFPVTIGNRQYLQIDKLITAGQGEDRDGYLTRCLQELYSGLEKIIRKTPYVWECWGYLHRNGMLGKIDDNQLVGDKRSLIQVPLNNQKIWFDRVNYSASLE